MRRAHLQSGGFTLIETMAALVLFAVAVVVLGAAYRNTLVALHVVEQPRHGEVEAAWVRQQVLLMPQREEVEQGGSITVPGNGSVDWQATIEETGIADLFHVDLSLVKRGADWDSEVSSRSAFYLYRPSWSEPVEREIQREQSRRRLGDQETRRLENVFSDR